jgi:conjugative transfer signal peptidase TraF
MTRLAMLALIADASVCVWFGCLVGPRPKVIWNASPSAPIGFYVVLPTHPLKDGDFVVARPPSKLADFLAMRHYLPIGVPLLKHIGALPGQIVCRRDAVVTIDGVIAASALVRDRVGRRLPVWQGCRAVAANEIFLLNREIPDSFDGRYFGPLPMSSLIGRARPLWTFAGR